MLELDQMRSPLASADSRPSGRSIDRRRDGVGNHSGSTISGRRAPIASLLTVCVLLGLSDVASAQDPIAAGEQVYEEHCASCHGEKLRSTGAMPDLKQQRADSRARFDEMVMKGRGQMPAWQGVVGREELDQLWAYIRSHARD
jgi:mono/diheme cytochrome c family protein